MDQPTPPPPPPAPVPVPAPKTCTSCETPMEATDNWCAGCGQKAYQGPPGFWRLIGEFFETVFNLDNRLFRTLAALAVPGRLTNYYLKGKQKPYFHPLRLFFFSGVLMVATYSFYTAQQVGDSLDRSVEEKRARAYSHRFGVDLRASIDSIQTSFPGDSVAVATDSLRRLMGYKAKPLPDSFSIAYLVYEGGLSFTSKEVEMSDEDFQLLSPTRLADKYEVEGTFYRYQFKQVVRISHLNLTGLTALMSQIIWGLLLLVPLAAGVLKLMYIRRKRRYIEHFIFTLNVHSFLFITQFLAALGLLLLDTSWLLIFSAVAVIIYFLLALKRVYGQGWGKTLFKAYLLSWGYFGLLMFAFSVTAVLALLVF